MFTGILMLDSNGNFWKLNDPNYMFEDGENMMATNTGHKMDDMEFVLDLTQYNEDPKDRFEGVKDIEGILKDFSDKPSDFDIRPFGNKPFSSIFPHGIPGSGSWIVPQVRAGDYAMVTVEKCVVDKTTGTPTDAQEHCGVYVVAVTQTGIITGHLTHDFVLPIVLAKRFQYDLSKEPKHDLHRDDLVSFPVTCVYGVVHGENWG